MHPFYEKGVHCCFCITAKSWQTWLSAEPPIVTTKHPLALKRCLSLDCININVQREIMINGPDRIFIEKDGRLKKSNISFSSEEKLYDVIQQIVALNNRVVNESGRQWTGDFSPVHF